MRVHLEPFGHFSPAMVRVARALTRHAPSSVTIVDDPDTADLRILYVIGRNSIEDCYKITQNKQRYAIVQCCLRSSGAPVDEWVYTWAKAALTWSYYDLSAAFLGVDHLFYHAPLGVDPAFTRSSLPSHLSTPRPLVITSGHVSGQGQEPIAAVWQAAALCGYRVNHVGTLHIAGIDAIPSHVHLAGHLSDDDLAELYRQALWVSGLRFVEGFELPAAEALACGSNALIFDYDGTRQWYSPLRRAHLIPECAGVDYIAQVMKECGAETNAADRQAAIARFDWSTIAGRFWARLAENVGVSA